jgi:DNA primase
MTNRRLSADSLGFFRLGYVANPLPGHEQYRGKIAVPYLTRAGVVSIRFRRIGDGDGPKYLSEPGAEGRIYNPAGFFRHERFLCLCEGEIDTITAWQCGLPAVGVPGAQGWQNWMGRAFDGFDAVFILADADDKGAGMAFAEKAADWIKSARLIPMTHQGQGYDVNAFVGQFGADALIGKIGVKA